jgi:peptide/nickel transport system permease protein
MSVATAEKPTKSAAKGMKTWDSPWLNPKFLVGLGMVLFMASMALWGPIVWDVTLARVASSPLNLPPPWAPGYRVEESVTTTTETEETEDQEDRSMTGNPFAQQETENEATSLQGSRFGVPSWDHPLGTESSGRDMMAVLLVGAPRSLMIGVVAAGIGMIVGIILGFMAGFLGGWVDSVIRTIADAFLTIPSLAVLIVISAFVSLNNVIYMALLLALFAWPAPTRYIRSQVLTMRERGYVQMAQLSGASIISIMFLEMMPNLLPYLASSFTGNVSGSILAATGLEVLGLGPTRLPTLGITIFYAIRAAAILRGMWWWWGVPIVALIVIFSGLFLITVGLDEIANPRLRGVQSQ